MSSTDIRSALNEHNATACWVCCVGHNVVVSTSTASGKSLCYNIPVLEAVAAEPAAAAIYLFPTKALAQDQLRAMRELCAAAFGDAAPGVEVYDGDTPQVECPLPLAVKHADIPQVFVAREPACGPPRKPVQGKPTTVVRNLPFFLRIP